MTTWNLVGNYVSSAFLKLLSLLPLELANKAAINLLTFQMTMSREENDEGIRKSYFVLIICTKYFDPLASEEYSIEK
jgi:hypothetical protein